MGVANKFLGRPPAAAQIELAHHDRVDCTRPRDRLSGRGRGCRFGCGRWSCHRGLTQTIRGGPRADLACRREGAEQDEGTCSPKVIFLWFVHAARSCKSNARGGSRTNATKSRRDLGASSPGLNTTFGGRNPRHKLLSMQILRESRWRRNC